MYAPHRASGHRGGRSHGPRVRPHHEDRGRDRRTQGRSQGRPSHPGACNDPNRCEDHEGEYEHFRHILERHHHITSLEDLEYILSDTRGPDPEADMLREDIENLTPEFVHYGMLSPRPYDHMRHIGVAKDPWLQGRAGPTELTQECIQARREAEEAYRRRDPRPRIYRNETEREIWEGMSVGEMMAAGEFDDDEPLPSRRRGGTRGGRPSRRPRDESFGY